MRKFKSILSAIILVASFVLVIVMMFAKISGQTPEIFGFRLLRISSESMEPELKVGDIILSRHVDDAADIQVGEVINYNGEFGSYAGKSITHEVIVAPTLMNGEYYLQTKGIASDYADPEIRFDQVTGIMVGKLKLLSAVYSFFMTPWGLAIVLIFLALLFINEAYTLRQLVKENQNEELTNKNQSSKIEEPEATNGEEAES